MHCQPDMYDDSSQFGLLGQCTSVLLGLTLGCRFGGIISAFKSACLGSLSGNYLHDKNPSRRNLIIWSNALGRLVHNKPTRLRINLYFVQPVPITLEYSGRVFLLIPDFALLFDAKQTQKCWLFKRNQLQINNEFLLEESGR